MSFVRLPPELGEMIYPQLSLFDKVALASTSTAILSWCRQFDPEIGNKPLVSLNTTFVPREDRFQTYAKGVFCFYPEWHTIGPYPHENNFKRLMTILVRLATDQSWLFQCNLQPGRCLICEHTRARAPGSLVSEIKQTQTLNENKAILLRILTCSESCGTTLDKSNWCESCGLSGSASDFHALNFCMRRHYAGLPPLEQASRLPKSRVSPSSNTKDYHSEMMRTMRDIPADTTEAEEVSEQRMCLFLQLESRLVEKQITSYVSLEDQKKYVRRMKQDMEARYGKTYRNYGRLEGRRTATGRAVRASARIANRKGKSQP